MPDVRSAHGHIRFRHLTTRPIGANGGNPYAQVGGHVRSRPPFGGWVRLVRWLVLGCWLSHVTRLRREYYGPRNGWLAVTPPQEQPDIRAPLRAPNGCPSIGLPVAVMPCGRWSASCTVRVGERTHNPPVLGSSPSRPTRRPSTRRAGRRISSPGSCPAPPGRRRCPCRWLCDRPTVSRYLAHTCSLRMSRPWPCAR
jgi:hypothetical protein